MSLNPRPQRKSKRIPLSAKIDNKKVDLIITDDGILERHNVVLSQGRKRDIILKDSIDYRTAVDAWRAAVSTETADYRETIKARPKPVEDDRIALKVLRDAWNNRSGKTGSKYITAQEIYRYFIKTLDMKEGAYADVDAAIRRLEYDGLIYIKYQPGLPIHGAGLGGDPNKRRMIIVFRRDEN